MKDEFIFDQNVDFNELGEWLRETDVADSNFLNALLPGKRRQPFSSKKRSQVTSNDEPENESRVIVQEVSPKIEGNGLYNNVGKSKKVTEDSNSIGSTFFAQRQPFLSTQDAANQSSPRLRQPTTLSSSTSRSLFNMEDGADVSFHPVNKTRGTCNGLLPSLDLSNTLPVQASTVYPRRFSSPDKNIPIYNAIDKAIPEILSDVKQKQVAQSVESVDGAAFLQNENIFSRSIFTCNPQHAQKLSRKRLLGLDQHNPLMPEAELLSNLGETFEDNFGCISTRLKRRHSQPY